MQVSEPMGSTGSTEQLQHLILINHTLLPNVCCICAVYVYEPNLLASTSKSRSQAVLIMPPRYLVTITYFARPPGIMVPGGSDSGDAGYSPNGLQLALVQVTSQAFLETPTSYQQSGIRNADNTASSDKVVERLECAGDMYLPNAPAASAWMSIRCIFCCAKLHHSQRLAHQLHCRPEVHCTHCLLVLHVVQPCSALSQMHDCSFYACLGNCERLVPAAVVGRMSACGQATSHDLADARRQPLSA